jgi:hypothetical protein
METAARRLHRLVEPIHLVTYFADEPDDALRASPATSPASGTPPLPSRRSPPGNRVAPRR